MRGCRGCGGWWLAPSSARGSVFQNKLVDQCERLQLQSAAINKHVAEVLPAKSRSVLVKPFPCLGPVVVPGGSSAPGASPPPPPAPLGAASLLHVGAELCGVRGAGGRSVLAVEAQRGGVAACLPRGSGSLFWGAVRCCRALSIAVHPVVSAQ